jgi:nucleoside phosphorylase
VPRRAPRFSGLPLVPGADTSGVMRPRLPRGGLGLLFVLAPAWAHAARPGLCATAATRPGPPYLAVVSAFPAELAPIAAATAIERTIEVGARPFYVGRLAGVNVLLGLTGIGPVNATATAEAVLARGDVAGLIMSGTAGTKHHIGDVVLPFRLVEAGRRGVQHPSPVLVALARRAVKTLPEPLAQCTLVPPGAPGATVVCLRFAPVVRFGGEARTVDPFRGQALPCTPGGGEIFGCELPAAAAGRPRSITTVAVEDNESAAVARVAARRHVPFLAVRSGSDGGGDPKGDRGFPAQFFDYYRLAAHNAADVTRAIVTAIARLPETASGRRRCRRLARPRRLIGDER